MRTNGREEERCSGIPSAYAASIAVLVWALTACGPRDVEDRIRSVETGLVEDLSAPGWEERTLEERMAHFRVPGLGIAMIDDYELSWARGYGKRQVGEEGRVTPDTLFQTASTGKSVMAALALSLVQTGLLDLDEDVDAKLRSWRVPANGFTERAPVTLRRLLSHSAGTTSHGYLGYPRGAPLPTLPQILDGMPPANSPPIRVEAVPGERHLYSNGGYLIAQQLMMDVTGKSFGQLLQDGVFGKLGMKHSHLHPLAPSLCPHAASGHLEDGRTVHGGWHVYAEVGAGPFWSTPSDMARFGAELMRAHQGRSDRLLSQDMALAMFTPQSDEYGLGLVIEDDGGDRFYAMHKGANVGFRSLIVFYPRLGQGVVIMANGDRGDALAREVLSSVSREYGWVPGLIMDAWMLLACAIVVVAAGAGLSWSYRARRRRRGLPVETPTARLP